MSEKKQFSVEFVIRSSPGILFNFLSTPSGLAQWFAPHVDKNGDVYSFFWDGYEEKAVCIDSVENESIRYQWEDGGDDEYFEFRIEKVDVTNDTVLVVNDFAEDYEVEDQKQLWDTQVRKLSKMIGGG